MYRRISDQTRARSQETALARAAFLRQYREAGGYGALGPYRARCDSAGKLERGNAKPVAREEAMGR